ncbi:hypothetical protein C7S14_7834 [Burkholderia cepacia]|nr:hypothetical protein C7S14_7834 [Burkholderia cepacia]
MYRGARRAPRSPPASGRPLHDRPGPATGRTHDPPQHERPSGARAGPAVPRSTVRNPSP